MEDQKGVVAFERMSHIFFIMWFVEVPNLVDNDEMLAISEMKHPVWLIDT